MTRGRHSAGAALLLALAGCQPVFYDLIGGAGSEGTGTTGHGQTTMSDPTTGPGSTEPGSSGGSGWPPPDPCGEINGGMKCGGPECPPCPPGLPCKEAKDCETRLCVAGICEVPECEFPGDCPKEPCRSPTCNPETRRCEFVDLDGVGCDDADPCTEPGTCKAGVCVAQPRDCSQFDDTCRVGFCNPQTGNCGVEFVDEGKPCDDGDPCTVFDACQQGQCAGKEFAALFLEDFADGQAWTLGELWQIGPAKESLCAELGAEDPAEDHSPGLDNALAGSVIGGCLPDKALAMDTCLTSPAVDTMVPGPLFLSYHDRLTSPPAPAASRVEVWTGQQWVTLFDSKGDIIDEPVWTEHVYDLSFFKNKGMKVRFCHHLPVQGLPIVAGWSVDDVMLGAPMCPP